MEGFCKIQMPVAQRENYTYDGQVKVRKTDKSQFYTGILIDTVNRKMCFFARLDKGGQTTAMSYIRNSNLQGEFTVCNSLALTENNDLIVVGTAQNGLGRKSALIIMLDDDLILSPLIKIWSDSASKTQGTPSQEAQDVVTTADGGIFVTGSIQTAFTQGGYDCFVLRLNYTLDIIYAKSFGTSENEQCYSIQVTRNYDYLYLGGIKYDSTHAYQEMIIYKFDSYTDSGIAASLKPTVHGDQLFLKNIVLTQKRSFSGANDNNILYFCGQTDYNNGDLIVGTVTSTSLSSIGISQVFRYGSPQKESIADCILSEDNRYLIVLMNTQHYSNYQSFSGTYAPIPTRYTFNAISPADFDDPYVMTACVSNCPRRSVYTLVASKHENIREFCEDTAYNRVTTYVSNYNQYLYSWTTCDFYIFDYNSIDCSLADVKFRDCDRFSGNITGSEVNHTGTVEDCTWPISSINTFKPWYNTNYVPNYCRNDQFKKNLWEYIFGNYTSTANRYMFYQQTFCIQNDATQSNNFCNYDDFQMIFEQDCTGDSNKGKYDNWFIIKIDLNNFNNANRATFPSEAAYFGDRSGDVTGYAIDIDDAGFIYISGTSTASRLGSVSGEGVWVIAKTHWRLTYESRYEQTNNAYSSRSKYLNKRFVRPRKFQNSHNPRNPPTSAGTVFQFTINFLTESSVITYNLSASDSKVFSYQINEKIFNPFVRAPSTQLFTYRSTFITDFSLTNKLMSDSYVSMNFFPPLLFGKSTTFTQYISLPNMCISNKVMSGPANNAYRGFYSGKSYVSDSGSIAGMSYTLTGDVTAVNYLSGIISVSEGTYYSWYESTASSFNQWNYTSGNPIYNCPFAQYGYFHDINSYESMRRYSYSSVIKVIVDDPQIPAPENSKNIPDISPTIGQRYEITNINSYFTTNCAYYKVKQNKVLTTATGTNLNTTMLPYWMMFYEQNLTISMYPVFTGQVYIDVMCFNSIDQYAINTFSVDPKDQSPINIYGSAQIKYTIQHDSYENVGQYFQWSQSTDKFYDPDATTDTKDQTYKHSSHTVWLSFISPIANNFNQIKWIGMIFGQSIVTPSNNIGMQNIRYQFQDQYSLQTVQITSFNIKINRQPSPTVVGIQYKFKDIDPFQGFPTKYFDEIFPFVKDDFASILQVNTGEWFQDLDMDILTYQLTLSDNNDRPDWMGFDIFSGQLRGYPSVQDSSQLYNLKISAFDSNDGSFSYFKQILVNSFPQRRLLYQNLQFALQRHQSICIQTLANDPDQESLYWYFKDKSDQLALQQHGLDFYNSTKSIAGIAIKTGVISMIPFIVQDVHGYFTTIYITITIKNYQIQKRNNLQSYKHQEVIKGVQFSFCLNNYQYYDPGDNSPLVIFASTKNDQNLPSWIIFEPTNRCFFGIPPEKQQLTIQIRATNQFSQQSMTDQFILTVIEKSTPKLQVHCLIEDKKVRINDFISITLPIQLFQDKERSTYFKISAFGQGGQDLPQWAAFNEENRTLFGYPKTPGIFYFDFQVEDILGQIAFTNIKILVEDEDSLYQKNILPIALSLQTLSSILILISYMIFYQLKTYSLYTKTHRIEQIKKIANQRFQDYKEIKIVINEQKSTLRSQRKKIQQKVIQDRQGRKFKAKRSYSEISHLDTIEDLRQRKVLGLSMIKRLN